MFKREIFFFDSVVDSGGAVVAGDTAIGVKGFSTPCAQGDPDAHARLSYFRPWIMSIVG
jgi:Trypsin